MDVNTFYKCKIIEILIEQWLWSTDNMCMYNCYYKSGNAPLKPLQTVYSYKINNSSDSVNDSKKML